MHSNACFVFRGVHENTPQQTCLRVQRYHQKKDRNVTAPIVKTQHNDRMSIQQSGTTNLLNTCLHSTMKTINFVWYIDVLCTNTFEEGFKLHQIVQEGLSLTILCLIQVCTVT
jgi:hypothetical protein